MATCSGGNNCKEEPWWLLPIGWFCWNCYCKLMNTKGD